MLITEHAEDDSSLPMDVIDFGEYGSQNIAPSGDISFSLDADSEFPQEDFLQQLSNDLEIPLLLEEGTCDRDLLDDHESDNGGPTFTNGRHNFGLGVLEDLDLNKWDPQAYQSLEAIQPDIEYVIKDEIKTEPPSPPSSISSLSSLSEVGNSPDSSDGKVEFKVVLESPPSSPPRDGDKCPSMANIQSCTIVGTSVGTLLPTTIISASQPVIVPQAIAPRAPKGVKIIRPKPSCSPMQVTGASPETEGAETKASPQAILLSAKEFEALTCQIKKSRNNGNRAPVTLVTHVGSTPVVEKPTSVVTPAAPAITCQLGSSRTDLEHIKAIKRQQRMIKNRESACLSRKKKKEYVSTLEEQLSSLRIENDLLRAENQALRGHLVELGVSISPVPSETKSLWLNSSPPLSPNSSLNTFGSSAQLLSSNTKKITAFFAVLFIVSLNVWPFGGLLQSNQMANPLRSGGGNVPLSPINIGRPHPAPGAAIVPATYSSGRTLLWSLGRGHPSIPPIDSEEEDEDAASTGFSNGNSSIPHLTCPLPINVTESIRLDSELRGWFGVEAWMGANISASEKSASLLKERKPRSWGIPTYPPPLASQKKPSQVSSGLSDLPSPLPTVQALVNNRIKKKGSKLHHWPLRGDSSLVQGREVAVYGPRGSGDDHRGTKYEFSALLEAIGRREDRFYVVSFSGDNLLLPASAPLLNSSHQPPRPKMTLLLPAVMPNGTVGSSADHITMMQIDCEVTDTQLMTVREGAIPLHLRTKGSTAQSRGNAAPCHNDTTSKGLKKARGGLHPYLGQVGVAGKGRL
ncbi:cyclic AMP-dependent transcription factor ATF-6 alpha [Hetaerina americana]|uniref:cyclic AMP-dependent transcription factor ATF-6 alpha n=1 Tax=Hetaerina americana TaxID=62018 RepID=UPI003A7F377F